MRRTKQLLLAVFTFVLGANGALGADGTDVLSALKRNGDWDLAAATNAGGNDSGFFASFIMTAPGLLDRAQGRQINECEVLWTTGFCLLTTKAPLRHARAPRISSDADPMTLRIF